MSTADLIGIITTSVYFVGAFAAIVAISLHRKPATAIAWILTIIFIPVLGLLVFLLIGFGRLPRRRREKQSEVNALMLERAGVIDYRATNLVPEWLTTAATLNENLGALPMVSGNSAELIEDYEGSFDAMVADIDLAQEYVHVEFYILVRDTVTQPFFDALARASARGVKIRLLSDHVSGFMFPERKRTQKALA